jgi:hypothetical protein
MTPPWSEDRIRVRLKNEATLRAYSQGNSMESRTADASC